MTLGLGLAGVALVALLAKPVSAAGGGVTVQIPVTPPTDHLQLAAPANATAGTGFNLVVTAQDRSNTITPGFRDTVHFTSSDPAAVLPPDYTFTTSSGGDNGSHTFSVTLKTVGLQSVTATDTVVSGIAGTASVTVNPAGAATFQLSPPGTAMQGSSFTLGITALDAFGNVATGYAGTVHFSSSDARALLPPDSMLVNGQGSLSVALRTAGQQTITGNDTVNPAITGSATISVIAVPLNAAGQTITPTEGASFTGLVATFTDPVVTDSVGSYSASIDWGDGSSSTPGTISQSGSMFLVAGGHTYVEEGRYSLTILITDADRSSAAVSSTASVTDASLSATGQTVTATEGVRFTGIVVASFTDADPAGTPSDYVATIDWGDGSSSSAGTISQSGSTFIVAGSHTYAEEGKYPVTVMITDVGGSFVAAVSSAAVADAALTPQATTITTTEGASFSGPVASFTDNAGQAEPAANYGATISWGDGASTAGVISTSGSTVSVSGNHTYSEEGTYTVTVVLSDEGGSRATANSTAQVVDAALTATPGSPVTAVVNGPFTATLATFTDQDPNGVVSDYTATVNWGDASTSTGAIAAAGGSFSVTATHTYAAAGTYAISMSIHDAGGSSASANLTAMVMYNICVLYDQTKAVSSGSTDPIKLELCDANATDLSSSAIVVTATAVIQISTNAPGTLEAPGNSNPDNNFRFDSTLGSSGGYIYNLSTKGLTTGTYALSFTVTNDPVVHSVQFEVK